MGLNSKLTWGLAWAGLAVVLAVPSADYLTRQFGGKAATAALMSTAIRKAQGGPMDWSWCKSANAPPLGVYMPGRSADAWLEKAFTSPEFEADPDTFRFLAWTNARVAEVNTKIRRFRYGDNIPTPFMPGERALMRAPVIKDSEIKLNTNEEATVLEIGEDSFSYHFEACGDCGPWAAEIPSWRVKLKRDEGGTVTVHTPSDEAAYNRVIDRIKDEATFARYRWKHLHDFQAELARMQSIYGMTVHTSQGSTFQKAFVDVGDIRRRERDNLLEAQQLFYVAVTRPSEALYLVGV
ncbi:MAG: ATP-binding domain-containing protein [Rhodospirillales bacterium]|nr:ATP-binding domain-containing protein [Rhodospirillales bacterium]